MAWTILTSRRILHAMKQLSLLIHGEVQGVNFRWFVRDWAARLHLTGWVQNVSDGTVAVLAEGEEDALKRFRDICAVGPERARVEKVKEEWKEIHHRESTDFQIRRSFI